MKKYQKIRDRRDGSIQTFLEFKDGFYVCMTRDGQLRRIREEDIYWFDKLVPISKKD